MTTTEAARELGLSRNTIQAQIRIGSLAARKRGRDYWITPAEVERYRRENLGRVGRPPSSRSRRGTAPAG